MDARSIVLTVVVCVSAPGVLAQSPASGNTPSAAGPPSLQRQSPAAITDSWRMFLTGNVTLNDGTAPPEFVVVKQTCGGQLKREVLTDAAGQFSFKSASSRGAGTEASQDASVVGRNPMEDLGESKTAAGEKAIRNGLEGCGLEAVLPGFIASPLSLNSHNLSGNPQVGTIILKPLSKAGGYTVSATTLQAPPKALKAYEKGLAAMKEEKWETAEREFGRAAEVYPGFAVAWYELGVARSAGMDGAGAEEAWKRSLQADPKYVKPYQPLIAMANQRHDWAQSEHLASEWINTDREAFPEAYLVDALANLMLDDLEKAEHSARESIRVDTQHQVSKSRYVLGYILGLRREFAASAEYFREYLTMAPHADNAALVRQQLDEYERAGLAAPKP